MEKLAPSSDSDRNSRVERIKIRKAKKRRQRRIAFLIIGFALAILIAVLIVVSIKTREEISSTKIYVTVTTDCGKVKGRVLEDDKLEGGKCFQFINIPYAQPPVGDLRWEKPILLSKDQSKCWTKEYPAHETTTKMCPQPLMPTFTSNFTTNIGGFRGVEDCLYLTVMSPNLTARLPVMVWIHGGGLIFGYNSQPGYSPSAELATELNIVTVSINYRLGYLGFISLKELWNTTPGDESYGNYGFMDQIAALQWVKNNIANFGGDPNSVTIIGESAGGTSVAALVASPLANNLFHRGIAQSPTTPLHNYTYIEAKTRNKFLSGIGCDGMQKEKTRTCLHKKTAEEVIRITKLASKESAGVWGLPLANESLEGLAMTDPVVLPVSPFDMKSLPFVPKQPVPIIVSTMAQEVGISTGVSFKDDEWKKMYAHVTQFIDQFNSSLLPSLFELYKNQTANGTLPPQQIYETLTTDLRWTCASNRLAGSISDSRNHAAYRLYISHQPSKPFYGRRFAFHSWDAFAFFDSSGKFSPHNKVLKSQLRSIFKRFIHNGTVDDKWTSYPLASEELTNSPPWRDILKTPVQEKQCKFWNLHGFQKFSI